MFIYILHRTSGRLAEKEKACISPDYMISLKFGLKLDENCGSSSLLKMLTSGGLQSAPYDPQIELKESDMKVPYICST